MSKFFNNTGSLAGSILRRDRIRIPVWVLSIIFFTVFFAYLLPDLYPSNEERLIMAETMKNPAITVMLGPGYGLDNYTDGAMMAHFMLAFSHLAVGIMSIVLTIRHTREDEEEGRIEMIRALPVGSLSTLSATMIIAILTNIVLSLATSFGLLALGIESMDFAGSMVYGATFGAIGIFFAAITSLFAQLSANTRSVLGYSFAFLIASYMVRGIGDVGSEALSLISPLGLILRTEAYVNNYWWPIWIVLIASAAIFGLALYLNSIRDMGAGFISAKPGRENASKLLLSPLGLAIRLQRTSIIAWTIGMLVLGASYGSILGDLEGFIGSNSVLQQMLPPIEGYSITERFITMLMTIMSILGSIPVLMYLLKLRGEEKKQRIEHLHVRAVSRTNVIGSYTFIALVMAPVIQLMSVLGFYISSIFVLDEPISFELLLKSGLVHLPAIWVLIGLAVLLIGVAPRFTGFTWIYLGYSFFVIYMGDMLQMPDWLSKLTPFGFIPQIPMEEVKTMPMIVLTSIALILIVGGIIGYNKRDIQSID